MGVGDVAEQPIGADRGPLLVVTDELHTAAAFHDVMHGGVQRGAATVAASSSSTFPIDEQGSSASSKNGSASKPVRG
jgi:hypothetical protein